MHLNIALCDDDNSISDSLKDIEEIVILKISHPVTNTEMGDFILYIYAV